MEAIHTPEPLRCQWYKDGIDLQPDEELLLPWLNGKISPMSPFSELIYARTWKFLRTDAPFSSLIYLTEKGKLMADKALPTF